MRLLWGTYDLILEGTYEINIPLMAWKHSYDCSQVQLWTLSTSANVALDVLVLH